jgi:hypothetical protein
MSTAIEEAAHRRLRPEELFERAVVLDWYDGPLSGMLKCRGESSEFCFELADNADVLAFRVFTVAMLPPGTIDRFVDLLARQCHSTAPWWPIWFPIWHFPTDEQRDAATAGMEQMLKAALSPSGAFCWNLKEDAIIAYRAIAAHDAQPSDWFPWLGLDRPGSRIDMENDEDA